MLDRFIGRKKKVELIPIIPPPGGAHAQYLFAQSLVNGQQAIKASLAVKQKPQITTDNINSNIPITKDITKLKTISISGAAQKINSQKNIIETEKQEPLSDYFETENKVIDQAVFQQAWIQLCDEVKQKGKDSLYVTLTARKPILLDNATVQVNIDNKTQQQTIDRDKTYIIDFLREKIKHPTITLTTYIEESNRNISLYTNKEKFKRLAEKNPYLIELQKRLNLDID